MALGDQQKVTSSTGAPECYRSDNAIGKNRLRVEQSVDIWSAGCVFSEAAVWVVYGWDGLKEYRRRRQEETDMIPGFRDGDCFHDGEKALSTVCNLHRAILQDINASDHVSGAVLSMVSDMLVRDESRPNAKFLYDKGVRIVSEAEERLKGSIADPSLPNGSPFWARQNSSRIPPQTPPELTTAHPPLQFTPSPQRQGLLTSAPTSPSENREYARNQLRHPRSNISPSPRANTYVDHNHQQHIRDGRSDVLSRGRDRQVESKENRIRHIQSHQDQISSSSSSQGASRPWDTNPVGVQGSCSNPHNTTPGDNARDRAEPLRSRHHGLETSANGDSLLASSPTRSSRDPAGVFEDANTNGDTIQRTLPIGSSTKPDLSVVTRIPTKASAYLKPQLSVAAALKWKDDKKRSINASLPGQDLLVELHKRDFVC